MTLNVPMPLSSLAIFVGLAMTSLFPFSSKLLVRTFILFSPSMLGFVEVSEVKFTTSSSTSLYFFRNYRCLLLEVERFWLLVLWVHGLVNSSAATSSWSSFLFLLWLVFERLFVTTSSSHLHLWCSTSYLAFGCNPFKVLSQQICLINLWLARLFWSYSWSTSSWVFKGKFVYALWFANICFNFLLSWGDLKLR